MGEVKVKLPAEFERENWRTGHENIAMECKEEIHLSENATAKSEAGLGFIYSPYGFHRRQVSFVAIGQCNSASQPMFI
jgi:hypothetical protein